MPQPVLLFLFDSFRRNITSGRDVRQDEETVIYFRPHAPAEANSSPIQPRDLSGMDMGEILEPRCNKSEASGYRLSLRLLKCI
jgi:hypothetical protein